MSDFENFKTVFENAGFPIEISFNKEDSKKMSILLTDEDRAVVSEFVFRDGKLVGHYGYVDLEVV